MLRALTSVTLGFFGGGGVVAIYGLLLGDAGYSPHLTGILIGAPAFSGALLRIPTSAWADKVGVRGIFMALCALGIMGMALTTVALMMDAPAWAFIILGIMSGCGLATFSLGAAQLGWSTPKERAGLVLGLYGGLAHLGPTFALMAIPLVQKYIDVAYVPSLWAAMSAVGLMIYAKFAHEPARPEAPPAHEEAADSSVGFATWVLSLGYFASFGVFVALCGWLPWLWEQEGQSASLATWFAFLAPLSRMPGGWLADRVDGVLLLILSSVVGAAGLFGLAMGGSWLWQLPMAIGLGVMMGAVFAVLPRLCSHNLGKASGLVGGLGATGGFILPPMLGWFAVPDALRTGLFVIAVLVVVTGALGGVLARQQRVEARG